MGHLQLGIQHFFVIPSSPIPDHNMQQQLGFGSALEHRMDLCRVTLNDSTTNIGNVVRIAPNELSFIDLNAWQEIYGMFLHFPSSS